MRSHARSHAPLERSPAGIQSCHVWFVHALLCAPCRLSLGDISLGVSRDHAEKLSVGLSACTNSGSGDRLCGLGVKRCVVALSML